MITNLANKSYSKHFDENIATWLNSFNWSFYITFTSRSSMSISTARSKMLKFHSLFSSSHPNSKLFWVAEPFDTKYGFHTHALIESPLKNLIAEKRDINNIWQSISGGSNGKLYNKTIILPYLKDKGAHFYLSKYINRFNSDWDIHF